MKFILNQIFLNEIFSLKRYFQLKTHKIFSFGHKILRLIMPFHARGCAVLTGHGPWATCFVKSFNLIFLSLFVLIIDLSRNGFNSTIPHWLFQMRNLVYLDLSSNNLRGSILDSFANRTSIERLRNMGSLCNLKTLILSQNDLNGEITELIDVLSGCNSSWLETLDLGFNDLGGFLPNSLGKLHNLNSIGNLSYLEELYLSDNSMNGTIPETLGRLSKLVAIELSENPLTGVVTEAHFSNLTSLKEFSNYRVTPRVSLVFNISPEWIPPFKLSLLRIRSCQMGPKFPAWLRNQTELTSVVLSNARISGTIPEWFWKLDLHLDELDIGSNNLGGRVPNSMKFLPGATVDLEENNFQGPLPLWSSNVTRLNLYDNFFSGPIPQELATSSSSFSVCPMTSFGVIAFVPIYRASRLKSRSIVITSLLYNNIYAHLGLCWNSEKLIFPIFILRSSIPHWLFNFSSLAYLDLNSNNLQGSVPDGFGFLISLKYIDLSSNLFIGGHLPGNLGKLCNLRTLKLSFNSISGEITGFMDGLSECNLKSLRLWSNSFVGSIPNSIGNLSSLKEFYISENQMNGIIPESSHFSNLTNLTEICQLGPKFPAWLRNQNQLKTLVLNNARISDTIPDWFWKLDLQVDLLDFANNQLSGRVPNSLKFQEQAIVDLSSNRFHGPFPHFSSKLSSLYLRDNSFSGPMPRDVGKTMPWLINFDVSWNSLNGTIPLSIGKITGLASLVLSNNNLSGEIPLIWNDKPDLYIVDMANNSLSGEIPSSMGTLNSLMFLILSGNKLSGEIPSSLQNCKIMDSFDLGDNRLSGNLPSWIGEMQSLLILRLRSNFFDGNIPSQVCSLSHLHILDLAHDNLSGFIPSCLGNLSGMATEISSERYEGQLSVVMKGRELIYQNTLYLVNSIDLSDNNLSGKLPELRNLSRLGTLNLSINHLTGNIPEDIGSLSQLETLDLSRNQLSGPIPPSMVSLTSLNHLNLSYNKLSGKIPTSNQFQTLNDPSIYTNNLALCGEPLPMKCPGDDEATTSGVDNEDHDDEHEDEFEMKWFYVSMGPGFVVGFWGVFGPLIINRSWRRAYFRFLDEMKDRMMVVITHLQKKCKWERRQHGT
ncbi:unnamed protein product, partial [Vitis vinifera]